MRGREERSAKPVAFFISNRRTPFGNSWRPQRRPWLRPSLTNSNSAVPDEPTRLDCARSTGRPYACSSAPRLDRWSFRNYRFPLGCGWRTYETSQLARPIDLVAPPSGQAAFQVILPLSPTYFEMRLPRRARGLPIGLGLEDLHRCNFGFPDASGKRPQSDRAVWPKT